jgi:hypothetical protein
MRVREGAPVCSRKVCADPAHHRRPQGRLGVFQPSSLRRLSLNLAVLTAHSRSRGLELAHYAANQRPEDGLVRNDTCYAGRFRPPVMFEFSGTNMTAQRALHPWPPLYEMHACQREAHGPRPQTRPPAELMSTSGVPTLLLRRRDSRHPQEAEVRLRFFERRRCRAQD